MTKSLAKVSHRMKTYFENRYTEKNGDHKIPNNKNEADQDRAAEFQANVPASKVLLWHKPRTSAQGAALSAYFWRYGRYEAAMRK